MSSPQVDQVVTRRTVEYHPSAWGDFFLNLQLPDEKLVSAWSEEAELLKEEVREMLIATHDKPSRHLQLINMIQLLGIACYFRSEIDEMLKQNYVAYDEYNYNDDDLSTVALRFRLLRQDCYNVPSDVFNTFKDANGKFKETLTNNVQGMLSLYEASFLGVQGEEILDEALSFTKAHLSIVVDNLDTHLAEHVKHALRRPIRRNVTKYEEWYFINHYEKDGSHDKAMLKLAKLNFNIVQNLYQTELKSLTEYNNSFTLISEINKFRYMRRKTNIDHVILLNRWWKDLDFTTKFPYARDRLPECYFWALGPISEPEYSISRMMFAKIAQLGTTMDDTFDVYGTFDELQLLTQTFESWACAEGLPSYLKEFFEGFVSFHLEIERHTSMVGRPYGAYYAKESEKKLVRAYMREERWLKEKYVPTVEEYMEMGVINTNFPLFVIVALCGFGDMASKENFDWLFNLPNLLVASSDHARVLDDIMTHQRERQREHGVSSVECYVKQYGVSRQEALAELKKRVENDWKIVNQEMLKVVHIPKRITALSLDLARVMDVFYKDFDAFTDSTGVTKEMLNALLLTPIHI